ncbi:MAG: formylglycine-generating enzyme family protein [Bacteroides sp.]|nr:formylglycine-generating enzyme family protein [Bacteroides sp.]
MKKMVILFCFAAMALVACEKDQKDVDIEMIYVEGGTFQMGGTGENEKPVHTVTLSSYYIGKYEVTQSQWNAVMKKNPSYFNGGKLPVECVNWDDAQKFCKKLSELTGKHYTLPTEAQWEYAARGGKKSMGYRYSGSNEIDEVAWYGGNSEGTTHPVGTKKQNELGIHDMSGNAWEWCADLMGNYSADSVVNPCQTESGTSHVLRGGRWNFGEQSCQVSSRADNSRNNFGVIGFRVVMVP